MIKSAIFSVLFLFSGSVSAQVNTIEIKIDTTSAKKFNVNDYKENTSIFTKDNRPFLLGNILRMAKINDSYIIYDHQQGVNRFDFNGQFINKINNKLLLADMWVKNDSVFLFDIEQDKVLIHNNQGALIESKSIGYRENNINRIHPYNDNYIGGYSGSDGREKSNYSLYDSDFKYIKKLFNKNEDESGIYLGNTTIKDEILFVKAPVNDIFLINNTTIIRKKYSIVNSKAISITEIHESDNYLFFLYLIEGKVNFAVYSKPLQELRCFKIETQTENYSIGNLFPIDDVLILYLTGKENVAMVKVHFKSFFK